MTSVKTECTLNKSYQDLYEKSKVLIKKDVCMKSYDAVKPIYLETDASEIGFGDGLLQIRDKINCMYGKMLYNPMLRSTVFARKNLSSAERQYSNI